MIIVPGYAYYQINKFDKESSELEKFHATTHKTFTDTLAAEHTVFVSGLPKDMGVADLQDKLDTVLSKNFRAKGQESVFVKARVIGNYKKVLAMCKELQTVKLLKAEAVLND
jgi:hypothetical protein